MRSWGALFALFALASCRPETEEAPATAEPTESTSEDFLDPLVVAPEFYTLELDNDYVKVLREKSEGNVPMHSHRDRVSVYLTDVKATIAERGEKPVEASRAADSVSWSDAVSHSATVENPIELLSIELKDLDGAEIPLSDVDATRTDAEHHEVLLENDRVRVLLMTYPAGATSPVHAHRPGAMVVLQGGRSRNIVEGEPQEETAAARGDVGWSEGSPPHATENLGDTDIVVIRVELKKKPGTST